MTSYIDPDRDQFEAFKALDRDQPIEMLNLVKFRAKAQYPPAHELANADLTGAQAYKNYGAETAAIIERIGARILWRGVFESTLIGPADEAWDAVFIARYPTAHAFLEMVNDPAYRAAVIHRQAAVETSRLIRCGSSEAGATFG
ncbi:DUF1330 domain-containing protein [Ruegeria sp. HKCCA4008]|uniref:DUF1330 domain-containing protein n=1 Tax=Ruegeria sp. HKCCA4008 TaxID=2682999 RepID=UPI001487E25F|nr:DUF1330 domain-containing protein [Ruegeria sp. HKCCA4008]